MIADEIEGGFTWTLASRLGHIRKTAESKLGDGNKYYPFLGVEFHGDRPQMWYQVIVEISFKRMCEVGPLICNISREVILESCQKLAEAVADKLAEAF